MFKSGNGTRIRATPTTPAVPEIPLTDLTELGRIF
jgi:hypothetical protein